MNRAQTMRRLGADMPMMKERITAAFRSMRKRGLFARQRLMCCSTCALNEMRTMLAQRAEDGKVYDGAVYFHTQDADAIERMFVWYGHIKRHDGIAEHIAPSEPWGATLLPIRFTATALHNPSHS